MKVVLADAFMAGAQAAQPRRGTAKPRTKACKTCTKRRVKCDGGRPTCERCKKGVFRCEGYGPQFVWMTENPNSRKRSQYSDAVNDSSDDADSGNFLGQIADSKSASRLDLHIHNPYPQADLFSMQTAFYEDGAPLLHRLWGWPSICPPRSIRNSESSTFLALSALGLAYWGNYRHEQALVARASVAYGKALSTLRGELARGVHADQLGVCRASLSLVVYEIIALTFRNAWIVHGRGLSRLVQSLGPQICSSESGWQAFCPISSQALLQHDIERKRCFLEDDVWQQCFASRKGDLWAELRSAMCFIPGLLQDVDSLRRRYYAKEDVFNDEESLRTRLLCTLRRLFDWRFHYESELAGEAYEVDVDPADTLNSLPTTGKRVFDKVIHYRKLESATRILFYNASLLRLFRVVETLPTLNVSVSSAIDTYGPVLFPGAGGGVLTLPNPYLTKTTVAIELARSVSYHLLPQHRDTGAFGLLWPLRICWTAVQDNEELREWIRSLTEHLAEHEALRLAARSTLPTLDALERQLERSHPDEIDLL